MNQFLFIAKLWKQLVMVQYEQFGFFFLEKSTYMVRTMV